MNEYKIEIVPTKDPNSPVFKEEIKVNITSSAQQPRRTIPVSKLTDADQIFLHQTLMGGWAPAAPAKAMSHRVDIMAFLFKSLQDTSRQFERFLTRMFQRLSDSIDSLSVDDRSEGGVRMVIRPNETGIEYSFVFLPAGKFTAGFSDADRARLVRDPPHDPLATHNASPEIAIEVVEGFFILDREITVSQLAQFVTGERKSAIPPKLPAEKELAANLNKPRASGFDRSPARDVSWLNAIEFCKWLTGFAPDGYEVRLPTEIEWEYAARGSENRRFPWKSETEINGWVGRGNDASPKALDKRSDLDRTWRDVFDMGGNVSEWCLDAYDQAFMETLTKSAGGTGGAIKYRSSQPFVSKPPKDQKVIERTYRGASYRDESYRCESAGRRAAFEAASDPAIGFRPVLVRRQQ